MFDIKGAFYHTYHPVLVVMLHKKNCPINSIKILASFLSNRNASLRLHNETWTVQTNMGCPQGSILSPPMWNIYIDDVLRISLSPGVRISGFAENISITKTDTILMDFHTSLQIASDFVTNLRGKQKLSFSVQNRNSRFHAKTLNHY